MAETSATEAPALDSSALKDLSNLLNSVTDWHALGVKLGVKSHELETIQKNYPHDTTRCKHEMLACCLRGANPPTWRDVRDALCQMGEHESAEKIRKKHLQPTKGQGVTLRRKGQPSRIAAEYARIRNINRKFASLVALGHRNLQGKIINMQDFRLFLAFCYSPKEENNDSREVDPSDFVDKILGSAQNLSDVLEALRKMGLLNYKNYDIFRSIIQEYASDDQELNEKLTDYEEEVAGYAVVTKMEEYMDAELQQHEQSEADPKLFNVLSLKVGENVTERTLQYVKEVWDSLAQRLQLPHSALLFEVVADGCIEIIWKFPSHLTTFITRRAQENTNYFREQHVLRVTIANRCIYQGEAPTPENINEEKKGPNWRKEDPDDGNLGGLQAHGIGHDEENIKEATEPGRKRDPDEVNLPLWLKEPGDLLAVVHKQEHPVHKNVSEEAGNGRKVDPGVEGPQSAEQIHARELENVSKVKDPNMGRPGDFNDGNLPPFEDFEGTNDEHKDDAEALPEHKLRLRSAIVISQNYSILWQYLDPSQLLPKLIEKFLISKEKNEEAKSYSQHAQTSIILRGLFGDYTPPNRLFKLADTLDTIPGQEHLGRKLLQDYKHLSTPSAHTYIPSITAITHSDFSEISQKFQQLQHEALNLLEQFPNVVAKLKQVLATLVFPLDEGKVVPLIDPHCYENALTVRELFRILAPHWNPLSPELLGRLLEASGCSMAVTKFAEFIDTRKSQGHLVLCVRQMPSLVDFRSVHSGPLSKLQSFHHSLFAQLPEAASSQNTIRISVEVDQSSIHLSDYERITTALSGLFWMPKVAFVLVGCFQSIISWQTFPEFLGCSSDNVTDISGYRLLSQCRVTRIAIGEDYYKCPTIKEVELWEASCYGQLDQLIPLIHAGTTVNVATRVGITPLCVACWKGHSDIVECLLRANADVNHQMEDGSTPLIIACQKNHGEIVDRLLSAKADVNLQAKDGATSLFIACQENHGEIVDRLLSAKADVNLQREDGFTPLMMACHENHGEIVERLLSAKADINLQTENGITALMLASYQGHPSVVKTLLQAGATVNSVTQDQETALMAAARKGNVGIVTKLIQHGANVNITNKDGLTALDLASLEGHPEVYQELVTHVSDQEADEGDEPEPPQPFEWTEFCWSPIVAVPGQEEEADEPEPPQPFEWTED